MTEATGTLQATGRAWKPIWRQGKWKRGMGEAHLLTVQSYVLAFPDEFITGLALVKTLPFHCHSHPLSHSHVLILSSSFPYLAFPHF